MDDPFDLQRFVDAQEGTIDQAKAELGAGEKMSHWMWFVFPQIAGLGYSPMARHFAISSLEEAKAYLRHPVLGPRLLECTRLVLAVEGRDLKEIFGNIDALKFRSSMTLFAAADPARTEFAAALDKYCGGAADPATVQLLKKGAR